MTSNGYWHEDVVTTTAAPFQALSLADLAAYDFPAIEWVVEDVAPSSALILLVGRPKAGKSLLMIDLAASVGLGEPFLDRSTTQGPVIYVPGEDALRLVRDRLWTRIGDERAAPIHVLPADGSLDQSVRLDDPASFARLAATVALLQPRVLILDPLREFHHRKENDADEMAALLRPLRQLAHESDTLIFLTHHRNKHATDASTASRGSSAITGGVDAIITLELSDESDAEGLTPNQVMTLHIEGRYGPRQRLAARLLSGLRWQPTDPRLHDDLAVKEKVQRHLEATGERLTAEELTEAAGALKNRVQIALRDLVKAGTVIRGGAGTRTEPYRYQAGYGGGYHDLRAKSTKAAGSYPPGKVYTAGADTNRCHACKGTIWRRRADGSGLVCATCHPGPNREGA